MGDIRKKSMFEIAAEIGTETERAIQELEKNLDEEWARLPDSYRLTAQLIEHLKKLDEEEINRIEERIGSSEVEEEFKEIYRGLEKAEQMLEEEDSEGLLEILRRLESIEEKAYENIEQYDLNNYETGDIIGRGANREAFELKNDREHILIRKQRDSEDLKNRYRYFMTQKQVPEDVNFAKSVKIGFHEGKPAEIMERAPGKEVHEYNEGYERWSKINGAMANAPTSYYQKLREDINTIRKYKLVVDPSKPENFFFHPDKGFTLIDVGRGNENYTSALYKTLTQPGYAVYNNEIAEKVTPEDKQNVKKIIEKMRESGFGQVPENTQETIEKLMEI